jgi:hypothetical protein
MSLVSALVVRRCVDEFQRRVRDYRAGSSEPKEASAGELWEQVSPELEKALAIYNRKESPDTPESSWIPGRTTKAGCQRDLGVILDTVLAVLGTCGASDYRQRIRNLQADNSTSHSRIVQYREQMLSAPTGGSQNFVEGLLGFTKESLKDSIAYETDRIGERNQQIDSLKAGFREHLRQIGLSVSPETADSFLLPVEDDIVSMAAVISNVGRITKQLQELVDASREAPEETKRYYGMYLLLVLAVDRIQAHFIQEIDERFLPRIARQEQEAACHIADAQAQLKAGGLKVALQANIAANNRAIEACRLLADMLRGQRRMVLDENRKVKTQEAAAVNTYRTVCLSINVAELIGYCQAAFRALRELRLPPLRPFQNQRLNDELQRLAESVAAKE